jgi:cobyrinic acid a,c-diamide synthase
LNNVASERHHRLVEDGMRRVGLPVLGAIARDATITLPERHLGLVQAGETTGLEARLDRLADIAEASLDLDAIATLAGPTQTATEVHGPALLPPGQRVAMAWDEAFSFAYPHVLSGWRAAGAEVARFSPLADEAPPTDCDCCWLPGGYPELHAGKLAGAGRFLAGLRNFAETRPVHGECGGYMVLGRSLQDASGETHVMAGLLPLETSYKKRKLHLGYRVARLAKASIFGPSGAVLVGHEFHYSSVVSGEPSAGEALAAVQDSEGSELGWSGHQIGYVSGTFFHAVAARS